jgi:hypothetical protein
MKAKYVGLVLFLISGSVARPQDNPPAQEKGQPQQQQEQKRPTLGAAPAPSLHGPRTSSITDPRRLLQVRKIYVERMDNSLGEKLIEGLAKSHRVRIVADPKEADAILRGTCFDSRRLKSVRSEVYLNDRNGASIWQDSVRRPFNPPPLQAAVSETADLIVAHLAESIVEAERR